MMKNDPVITQIRAARSLISARFGHDPQKIVDYYIKFQEKYRARLINLAEIKEEYQENAAKAEALVA